MYTTTEYIMIVLLVGILLGTFAYIPMLVAKKKEDEFCKKHRIIHLGMLKNEVIYLLGEQYTISYLKNGIEKLEWKYRHMGYTGRLMRGIYAHSRSFTRKISVKFQNNRVIEVNSLNMD